MTTNLYALIETRPGHPRLGEPFYIGIGTATRPYRHLQQSRTKVGHRNLRLHEILVGHQALGFAPRILIIASFETKDEAGKAEKAEIAKYGREGIDPRGTLCNLAKGGQGPDAELMRLPEVRKRNSEAQKRRSPESRAGSDAALAANRLNPEVEAKRRRNSSAPQKASWSDPEIRAKRTEAMKGKKKTASPEALAARQANAGKANTPEANAKKGEAARLRWADPEFRAAMAAKRIAAWQDPEKRARMLAGRSEGISESWKDPEVRAKRIAGILGAVEHGDSADHDKPVSD